MPGLKRGQQADCNNKPNREVATSKAPVHLQQPPLLQAAAQLLLDAAAAAATSPAIHKQVGRWAYY